MLIIGSRALQYHAQERGVPFRSPGDTDVLCTAGEMRGYATDFDANLTQVSDNHFLMETAKGRHMEFEVADESGAGSTNAYLKWCGDRCNRLQIAPLEILCSIKKSHLYLSKKKWKQHLLDYHLMKSWGYANTLPEITKMRRAEYAAIKTPSLNKTAEEFFDDHVSNKTFIHDEIHAVMAHREKPMFEYIKVDTDLVKCSKEKFFALSPQDQMRCVLEEAYVIALERAIIPMLFDGKKLAPAESALDWALFRICTTLTSGWFREFAAENYPAIKAATDTQYVQKFLNAVDTGKIRRINAKSISDPQEPNDTAE